MNSELIQEMLEYLQHRKLHFVSRGNDAIEQALSYAKSQGCGVVGIQDQGRWLTYKKLAEKVGISVVELQTDFGKITPKSLNDLPEHSVLLYTNPAGYIGIQDMKSIYNECQNKDILVICDISGGIGEKFIQGMYADIMLGSFGRWKPIWMGQGGFISFREDIPVTVEETAIDTEKLSRLWKMLPTRLSRLHADIKKIKTDLADMNIVHKEDDCIGVVIEFSSDEEKNRITSYCADNDLEWELCPREIRVNVPAISIEVKRRNYYIDNQGAEQ